MKAISFAQLFIPIFLVVGFTASGAEEEKKKEEDVPPAHQYFHGEILVEPASADEPVRADFSLKHAVDYLDRGAAAWTRERNCVSCHTNGSYLLTRPALIDFAGKPDSEIRDFFVNEIPGFEKMDAERRAKGITPTKIVYVAAGLATWDAHVTGELSEETRRAIEVMFAAQSADGSWKNIDSWPPLESSNYHSATVAAMAVAMAPGWMDGLGNDEMSEGLNQLKRYLQSSEPPHDYGRLLLLWTSAHLPGLIPDEQKKELIGMIRDHQREDGGWSLRTFSTPEKWGGGNRAEKLRAEPAFGNPESDGHMTGLAVLVLRECGVSAEDPDIQRGVAWLLANQRESGRWWTRSLNTDKFHFITYSGTCYPLLALAKCGVLEPLAGKKVAVGK